MKDFTLAAYGRYLDAVQSAYRNILRVDTFVKGAGPPDHCMIIRHDVDRKPGNAMRMAALEADRKVRATYYFRTRPAVFDPRIIAQISSLGHEIGYHYECLSDCRGDREAALEDFARNLARLRAVAPVATIAMHGRPLSPHVNLAMWQSAAARQQLAGRFGIIAEAYLDIDYTTMAYISDTGRNWSSQRFNRRDYVHSQIRCDFQSGEELIEALRTRRHARVMWLVHPERWSHGAGEYLLQWGVDHMANLAKTLLPRRTESGPRGAIPPQK